MIKKVIMSVAAVALAGCVAYHTPPMDRRVTISPDLGSVVYITDIRMAKLASQHYTMQANVVNNTDGIVRLEYRTVWLDETGTEIPSVVSTWQPISAAAREIVGLASTAPSSDAVDFRFYVQPARR